MAVVASVTVAGVVRATWDDATQLYTEFASNGTTQTLQRAYTQVELDAKAERVARATAQTNLATLQSQIAAGIASITADITGLDTLAATANATINSTPSTTIKQLGADLKRTDKAVIALARIISDQLSTADTGT